jgi:hypothetical protein
MVLSLIVTSKLGLPQWHIMPLRDLSHASTVWQIPAPSQFLFNLR